MIDHLSNSVGQGNVAIEYIFFDYKNHRIQTADVVIRCILKQVLCQMEHIPEEVESLFNHCHRYSATPDFESLSSLINVCLKNFTRSFILLDALDEFNAVELEKLVASLKQVTDSTTKLFCTSRPHIAHVGNWAETKSIEIFAHEDDIRNYLAYRMDQEWKLNDRLRSEAIGQLVANAQGK